MREKEEARPSGLRRVVEDEHLRGDEELPASASQSLETLKEGYSWVRAMETRHPGWHLYSVTGFPFTLPTKELSASRVCLLSLAGVYRTGQKPFNTSPGVVSPALRAMRFRDRGDWSFRVISAETSPEELAIAHAHYEHEDADEDINCAFPLSRLRELVEEDFIGECAPAHYSMMGYVPEVKPLLQTTVSEIIPRLRAEQVDAVVVSGGCELSHQSAGLVQREVEAAGIPTVGVSVCQDITYQLQVPRAVSVRFPKGNPFGSSMDASMQSRILRDALSLLHTVQTPGEIVTLPYDWIKL
jgi:D-proline reductase (dithiol) PrdB